jgi:hypothetical protein
MRDPQIALVGTQGSGKTVLTSVLAKRLASETEDGFFLYPLDNTDSQINEWLDILESGQWLASTPPGTLIKLHWNIHIKKDVISMWMFDSAGQDLTKLFSKGGYKDDYLNETDRKFVDKHLGNATIFLILLNPRDFVEQSDKKKQRENAGTIQNALAFLQEKEIKPRIAFILTAWDEYEEKINLKYGGMNEFIKQELPALHSAFIKQDAVSVFPIAAVADTVLGTLANGKQGRVPAPNFTSKGLKPLFTWIAKALVDDVKAQEYFDANEKWLSDLRNQWNNHTLPTQGDRYSVKRFINDAKKGFPKPEYVTETQENELRGHAGLIAVAETRYKGILDATKEKNHKWKTTVTRSLVKYTIGLLIVTVAIVFLIWYYARYQDGEYRKEALAHASKAQNFAIEASRYSELIKTDLTLTAASNAAKEAQSAGEAAEVAQRSLSPHSEALSAKQYAAAAESAMNVAKDYYEGIINSRNSANTSAQATKKAANQIRSIVAGVPSEFIGTLLEQAEKNVKQAFEAAEEAQKTNEPHSSANLAEQVASQTQNYVARAEEIKTKWNNIQSARSKANDSAQAAGTSAHNAGIWSLQASCDEATKAAKDAEYYAELAQNVAESAQETNEPQQYANKAATYAADAEKNAIIAKKWMEHFRIPRPEIVGGNNNWELNWCCVTRKRTWGEWWDDTPYWVDEEHRAEATVTVINKGGAGEVKIVFNIKGKSESKTKYFERGETAKISGITVNKLPNHDNDEDKGITFEIQKKPE